MTEEIVVAKPAKVKKEKKKETTGEMIRSLLFAVLLALAFRSIAYEPFHIPSGSMLSTLYKGDYIFVSKLSYGYTNYSFPFSPKLFDGRVLATLPERGDVVVFRNPSEPTVDYIKRVVGLPGETIQIRQGRVYINDIMVELTRDGDVSVPDENGGLHPVARYIEKLPNGATHTVLDERSNGNRDPITRFDSDNTQVYTVPAGHYFMMGDNRDNSQDSRFTKALGYVSAPGFVPFENMIGRAEIIAFSWSGEGGRWFKKID